MFETHEYMATVILQYRDTPNGPRVTRELPFGLALRLAETSYDSRVIDPVNDSILFKGDW